MSKLKRYKLVGGMVFADEYGDYVDADDAIAEIERLQAENAALAARVAKLETPTHFWGEDLGHYASDDLDNDLNDMDARPGDVVEVTPVRAMPTAWYGAVPDPGGAWDDGVYAGWLVDVIGPFPTRDAAKAEADRITAEHRAAWEAKQGVGRE